MYISKISHSENQTINITYLTEPTFSCHLALHFLTGSYFKGFLLYTNYIIISAKQQLKQP